jgi:hypothetical protein
MITADVLSRHFTENDKNQIEIESNNQEIKDEHTRDVNFDNIMNIHEKLNHRRIILNEIISQGIVISKNELDKILSSCMVCKKKERKIGKTCEYVNIKKPGERIGVDILELTHGDKIVMAIDYFSRYLWAKCISTKEPNKICAFLKEVYGNSKYKCIVTDNGREFSNKTIEEWTNKNKIEHTLAIPYYHQSNGRIERANRTIRMACKKTTGPTKKKLKNIIMNYNSIFHIAIGMSPSEARKEENWNKAKMWAEKYKKEFGNKNNVKEVLKEGEKVLIRNEVKNTKMCDEYHEEGIVKRRESFNVYEVENGKGNVVRRHISQLKRI